MIFWPGKKLRNKKVLPRERKRHTARRVASAHYAALSNVWWGGVPQVPPPPSKPGWGVPWVPPTIQTWDGVPPRPEMGYPLPRPEMGYPPT